MTHRIDDPPLRRCQNIRMRRAPATPLTSDHTPTLISETPNYPPLPERDSPFAVRREARKRAGSEKRGMAAAPMLGILTVDERKGQR